MADELEELWKKLSFTNEEDANIVLGSGSTKAAKDRGKNCLVMKVLSSRSIMLDSLRKNLRMIWKLNKGVQISVLENEMFMVEFGDEKDKKKVLEMSPWSFEKQLVLLQKFKGEQAPKEIQLARSPFWVQIHNLPLKSRTGETGKAIGATLGEVLDVDVAESGVQWENLGPAKMQDTQNFQYGLWLRGDIISRKNMTEESQVPINTVGVGEEPWSTSGILGKNTMEKEISNLSAFLGVAEDCHEEGRVNNQSKSPGNILPILGKECVAEIESREIVEELKRWETKTH
nr:hypothetical protein CFP56_51459 [Quercus suber]